MVKKKKQSLNIKRCAVKLKQRFGSTQDITKSGLLLPDASIIPTWSPSKGYTAMGPTHLRIGVYAEDNCKVDKEHKDFHSGAMELLNAGAIAYRFIGKPSDCDVSAELGSGTEPTAKQMRLLKDAKKVCRNISWAIEHRWGGFCIGSGSKEKPRWIGELRKQWDACNRIYEESK